VIYWDRLKNSYVLRSIPHNLEDEGDEEGRTKVRGRVRGSVRLRVSANLGIVNKSSTKK